MERMDTQRNKILVSMSSMSASAMWGKRGKGKRVNYRGPAKDVVRSRMIKANMEKKDANKPYLIFDSGINITPKLLTDLEFSNRDIRQMTQTPTMNLGRRLMDIKSVDSQTSARSLRSSVSKYSLVRKSIMSQASYNVSSGSVDVVTKDDISFVAALELSDQEEELMSGRAPSMFRLREDPPPKAPQLDTQFKIELVETDTVFHIQLPSQSDNPESDIGKEISEANDAYERGLEKSKALSHIAVQTTKVFRKHRKLYMPRICRKNAAAFASVWDMHDTYENLGMVKSVRDSMTSLISRAEGRVEKIVVDDEQKEYESYFEFCGQRFNKRFLNSLMIMERLLTRDYYRNNQLLYQGLFVQDPFSTEVNYNYTLTHLWTFYSDHVRGRCVTSMSWNPKNKDIIAVGYGKYRFTTKCDGLVCIWNVKSPKNPERCYDFPEDPVTFITFSNCRWHILAVGFYSGVVMLIDIVARSLLVKANNKHYPLYHPVRQMRWFPRELKATTLVTCGKGGRVFRYKKSEFFKSNKIMTLGRPHGSIHGVDQPRKCFARRVLVTRQPAAEVLVRHPQDPQIYLVGSAEGCVYICSVQHRHDYKDIFFAHNGPIYNIQFNPFCSKVFLTCGADWCIRIWADGVYQPLITLESGMAAVQDALWSPLHATVIISTTGSSLEVWDIRRRISKPMSTTQTPAQCYNNVLQFSHNKYNICVGDVEGNVHVMGLAEMPFSASYQESVLVEAIHTALITRPDVLHTLRQIGPPFVPRGFVDDYRSKLYRRLNRLHEDII